MANEIKEAVLGWSERQLKLLKMYLPYVVIVALSYGYMSKDKQLDKLRTDENAHLQKDIEFARDAYQRSTEAYSLMIQTIRNEKDTQARR
jgi:hypothetical protein